MSIVISVYSRDAFKEYLLPSLNNADYSVILHKDFFHIQSDVRIRLEVIDEKWKFLPDSHYQVKKNSQPYFNHVLADNDILAVTTVSKEELTIIVKVVASVFHSYEKFRLGSQAEISIGKDAGGDIIYDYQKMVSKLHARLIKQGGMCRIINESPNGTYVNSMKVEGEFPLSFGDYINIMGLHMVCLGDILAIDTKGSGASINSGKLTKESEWGDETVYLNREQDLSEGKTLCHRAPRSYETPDTEGVEIEAPPTLNKMKQQPLYMVIGPSVTMALPMLLGCAMMVYATSSSGGGSALYMYSGLVMSLSSALIGIMWALTNIRQQKKEEKAQEDYRFQTYSQYLLEKTEEIKEKYEETTRMLSERYPSAEMCLGYDEKGGTLWNRNRSHEDFLTHRLGVGNIPFQIPIEVPKRRFTLTKDELEGKPDFIKKNYESLYDVPVTLDLLEHSLIGVVGGEGKTGAINAAAVLSAQIAAGNCYTDVKLGYIYNGELSTDYEKWKFAKWLPHVWSEDKKTRFVASGKEQASDVFYELANILRARSEELSSLSASREKEIPKPYYVIFISDVSALEGELFAKYVFAGERSLGLTTILLTERYEELPNNCDFIIENTEDFQGMYDVFASGKQRQKIVFDQIQEGKLEKFARHLSTLRVLEVEEGGEIPSALTFFDMLKIQKPSDIPVKEYWAKNRTYENIRGIIGQKAGAAPCYLDVHEKYHGPHGLVAGTTGSGKSETLQTYMLSLAVNYSPDDIGFFVIDYKGGGMANLFDGLPHLVGQISNLSGNQVRRAMISIKSENRRRQRIFTENGVNNINLYTKLYKNGEALIPVPHLFIVIDEFAELKREEPEFMRELISVAQVGRSLGVHLILATQKPSGTVDDNIWSNSKFRLCLRVQDRQDSNDMLHKPDAAYITQAGRCYLQVGNDEVYELFQSGYSGAVYDKDAVTSVTDIAKMMSLSGKVDMTGNSVKQSQKRKAESAWAGQLVSCLKEAEADWNVAGYKADDEEVAEAMYLVMEKRGLDYAKSRYNTDRLKDFVHLYHKLASEGIFSDMAGRLVERAADEKVKLPQMKDKTQLDAIKEHLAEVARENGYDYQQQLWMPVIPDHIYLEEFEEFREERFADGRWKEPEGAWDLSVIIGRMDDPENQNQMPLVADFAGEGHIAICGNIVSGKSTMMQTMVYALIQKYSPETVNIYALDFSSKMMRAFAEAPHVGGIMCENDLDKIGKFFNMLTGILEERKALFQGGNYSEYVKVHGIVLPAIILFIDNYFSMKEKTGEAYEEFLIQLSREGVSHGIFLVVNGAGFGMNDITLRVGENISTVLCLALQDKYAYRDLLHTVQIEMMPEAGIKGRGLAAYGKRVLEYQIALVFEAENDYQRMEGIKDVCHEMKEAWTGRPARKVPEIPEKPVWSEFVQLEGYGKALSDSACLPVGYNEANAEIFGVNLRETYCYTVYGGAHSGKTNFMRVCLQAAMDKDSEVCVIDGPDHDFAMYSQSERLKYVSDEQGIFDYFQELTPEFVARNKKKHELEAKGMEGEEIFDAMTEEKPHFIFISDLSWFVPLIYNAELDMRGFLETIIEKGQYHNIFFLAALPMEKRHMTTGYQVYELFTGYKTGIHFGGKVSDNQVLSFDYMSFVDQGKTEKPGIGILPSSSNEKVARRAVIPLARK